MNKKGFTLTELMAVLIILAVVTIISVTSVMSARDKANQSLDKNTESLIISATKRYISEENESATCVNISTLVDNNYLKNPIIDDKKKNDELLTKSVNVEVVSGIKKYKVAANTCSGTSN